MDMETSEDANREFRFSLRAQLSIAIAFTFGGRASGSFALPVA
jgi:hypothetical protein